MDNYKSDTKSDTKSEMKATQKRHRSDTILKKEKKEKYKKIKDMSFEPSKNGTCPYEKIVELYHKELPELPGVREITDKRKLPTKKLWEHKRVGRDLKRFRSYFEYIRESKFLMGGVGKKWQADFEWITNYNNFVKIIEGKYHN